MDKDLSINHLVKNNNYVDFTPKELKDQKRFIDENKDKGKKFSEKNSNTSNLNIKNHPDNQPYEINEIKAVSSHNISNNKDFTNARAILRDNNDKEIKKIEDPDLIDSSNQKKERYLSILLFNYTICSILIKIYFIESFY